MVHMDLLTADLEFALIIVKPNVLFNFGIPNQYTESIYRIGIF
jgi:hypothetical protein